jgi:hypothetical protein
MSNKDVHDIILETFDRQREFNELAMSQIKVLQDDMIATKKEIVEIAQTLNFFLKFMKIKADEENASNKFRSSVGN